MKQRSGSGNRTTQQLSEALHHQLNMYALAATAAGVGALALAQPAEARIIYTPAHVVLTSRPPTSYNLDLNHDGVKDFVLHASTASNRSSVIAALFGSAAATSNKVWRSRDFDSALPQGVPVGPKRFRTSNGYGVMAVVDSATYADGPWANRGKGVRNRYLGLKFVVKREVHYGWARLNVQIKLGNYNDSPITATLIGYAYETIPNKPIIAGQTKGLEDAGVEESNTALTVPTPEPATLGVLALGSPGLSIWKREESAVASQ
jgi:hypothetical protein